VEAEFPVTPLDEKICRAISSVLGLEGLSAIEDVLPPAKLPRLMPLCEDTVQFKTTGTGTGEVS
jgi:hypothetical protein